MKEVKGDILTGVRQATNKIAVLHGCNCMHIMGAGIALYLRKRFKQVSEADLVTQARRTSKLGTYSVAEISENLHVLNCYTQFGIQPDVYGNPPVDYNAIRVCLQRVARAYKGWEIRLPKIGCGLAGGDWVIVKNIIEEELVGHDVVIYEL